jgi:hypothetical protein
MVGALVGAAVGVLLVWWALKALRCGELVLPGGGDDAGKLVRGEASFWVAVVVMMAAGVWLLAAMVQQLMDLVDSDPGAFLPVEGPGYRVAVPERWRLSDELAGAAAPEGRDALAFVHPHGELVVLSPPAAGVSGEPKQALASLVETLRDPILIYDGWEMTLQGSDLDLRMAYATPRGRVTGRVLARVDDGARLRSVHAFCTYEGDAAQGACDRVVGSLELVATEGEERKNAK